MKKLLFFIIGIFFYLSFTGCLGTTYNVYNHKITSSYYDSKNGKRIVGVFLNTKENQIKVKKAIQEVLNYYKKMQGDTLKSEKRPLSLDEITQRCKDLVRGGLYGYYRNAYEANKLLEICIDRHFQNRPVREFYTGYRLKVLNNNCIYYLNTYNGKRYLAFMCIRTQPSDKYIVVYIKGRPQNGLPTNMFIELNNKLIEALKEQGLKNSKKSIFLDEHKERKILPF
jgi:hypothetical protein